MSGSTFNKQGRIRRSKKVLPQFIYSRELKQTDSAAVNKQISIQKDSRPSEFSRPLTSFTLKLNGNLNEP